MSGEARTSRRLSLCLLVGSGLAFVTLTMLVRVGAFGLHRLDLQSVLWVTTHRGRHWEAWDAAVTAFGSPFFAVPVTAIACAVAGWADRRWRPMVEGAVALVLLPIGVLGLKVLIGRTPPTYAGDDLRPWEFLNGRSFPSGHTATALVCWVIVARAFTPTSGVTRRVAVAAAAVGSLVVGAGMVVGRAHWPTDIPAGWLLGVAVLAVADLVTSAVRPRRSLGAAEGAAEPKAPERAA